MRHAIALIERAERDRMFSTRPARTAPAERDRITAVTDTVVFAIIVGNVCAFISANSANWVAMALICLSVKSSSLRS